MEFVPITQNIQDSVDSLSGLTINDLNKYLPALQTAEDLFSEIVGNSNVLIMPSQHSAAISYKMIKSMSRAKVIGPLLIGLGLPIEIAPLRSSTSDIINLASIAAYSADVIDYNKN